MRVHNDLRAMVGNVFRQNKELFLANHIIRSKVKYLYFMHPKRVVVQARAVMKGFSGSYVKREPPRNVRNDWEHQFEYKLIKENNLVLCAKHYKFSYNQEKCSTYYFTLIITIASIFRNGAYS